VHSVRQQIHSKFVRLDRWLYPDHRIEDGERSWRWYPLAYLALLFAPFFAGWVVPSRASLGWTLASLLVFAPLWVAMNRWRDYRSNAALLACAALGCALLPVNPFANNYVIFACAGAAWLPRRRMLWICGLALSAFVAAVLTRDWPPGMAVFLVLLTMVISALVVLSNRLMHAKLAEQARLRRSQAEVGRLATLAERERIGRDLHDLLGHTLSLIAIKSELASRLAERDIGAARREIADVERIARESLTQVRQAVAGMRREGLSAEAANARLALDAVGVAFDFPAVLPALDPESESTLAFALREAVTNVVRHARATKVSVSVTLALDDAMLAMHIADDGCGGAEPAGNGLRGMRERIEARGGALGVVSLSGKGTELTVRLPQRPLPDSHGARPLLKVVGNS